MFNFKRTNVIKKKRKTLFFSNKFSFDLRQMRHANLFKSIARPCVMTGIFDNICPGMPVIEFTVTHEIEIEQSK